MKPEIKQQWVAALRSGEYKQGTSQLRSAKDNYCCLGVLCDLYAKANNKPEYWKKPLVKDSEKPLFNCYYFGNDEACSSAFPVEEVMDWAGTEASDMVGQVINNHGKLATEALAHINDVRKYNFNQIADVIEKSLGKKTDEPGNKD